MHAARQRKRRGPAGETWFHGTSLFREWQVIKEEILRHKWYESEKAGHDIGWEHAMTDWFLRHRPHHQKHRDDPPESHS